MQIQRVRNAQFSWIIKGKRALILALVLCLAMGGIASAVPVNWKISGEMADDRDVSSLAGDAGYQVTPDSQNVVFLANRDDAATQELFIVPIHGGTVLQLNAALVNGGNVESFKIAPDGTRVVYLADQVIDGVWNLYSVPITGGTPVKLNGPSINANVEDYIISPDSQRVVFSTSNLAGDILKLFAAWITGGEPVALASALIVDFEISTDSSWVVYTGKVDETTGARITSIDLLHGYTRVDIGGVEGITSFDIAPNSGRVVYAVGSILYSVKLDGTDPQTLWTTASTLHAYSISPNNLYLVFNVTTLVDSAPNLLAIPVAGGGIYYILSSVPVSASIGNFEITPNSERVVFIADDDGNGQDDLFSALTTGGDFIQLNDALIPGGDVKAFKVTPNSLGVVYLADQAVDGVDELFSTNTTGGDSVRLNRHPIPTLADVDLFAISLDSQFVVYRSDQDVFSSDELFSVLLSGGTSYQVNNPLIQSGDVKSFKISADGKKTIYLADQVVDEKNELFASVDGTKFFLPVVTK